jgi:tetratricopeptide (TPR) repeat protein
LRRKLLLLGLTSPCLLAGAGLWAKFGITKTHAAYLLPHPPAFYTPGRQLSLQVTSLDPRGGMVVVPRFREMLQQLLVREDFLVTPAARTKLQCTVSEAVALVERQTRWEPVNVHVGEHTEKDAKGREKKVEDCRNQQAEVTYLASSGSFAVHVTATDLARQSVLFALPVRRLYREESPIAGPPQCGGKGYGILAGQLEDPHAILMRLSEEAMAAIIPPVAGFAERKDVLLAVDDELKPGNAHAQVGNWDQALALWEAASTPKPETEAARQYNLGVAHEALSGVALKAGDLEQAAAQLAKATEAHDRALVLDPDEKYFRDSVTRLFQVRQMLEGFRQHQSLASVETAGTGASVSIPGEGAPAGESRAVRDFRMFARQRITAERWEPSEEFQQRLAARGAESGLTLEMARQVVDSEVKRFLLLRQSQQKYQELFEELVADGSISTSERTTLRNAQRVLHLPDDLAKEVETQFQFTEEGVAPPDEGGNVGP